MSSRSENKCAEKWKCRFPRIVIISRCIFVVGLVVVATLLGFGAYSLASDSETKIAEEQFESIAERALSIALEIILRKRLGAKSLATTASYAFPNEQEWPYVNIVGFEAVSGSIIDTASATAMGFCPLVMPDQLDEFNDYMYNTAFVQNNYPNTTGVDDVIGPGVFGFDEQFQKYIETDGSTHWQSQYNVIWPVSMHSAGPRPLMYNIHSLEILGVVIDEMQECTDIRNGTETLDLTDCAILSDINQLYKADGSLAGPSAFIMQPVYPANDPNKLTGLIYSTMQWDDVLLDLFARDVDGIDCVLATETKVYTYRVHEGVTTLLGEGDLHGEAYSHYSQTIDLYSPGLFSHTSASYTLTLYPTNDFFKVYSTHNPMTAVIVALCSVAFTSILFFLFDYFVRQEFHQKQELLQAKRQYMRYISHEVRTPLNAVVMGAQLIQDEMLATFNQFQQIHALLNAADMQKKLSDWTGLDSDILTSARSAVDVLSDLLNYDKVESGKLQLELTVIPIWDLIKRATLEFKVSAAAKKIDLDVDFGELMSNGDVEAAITAQNICLPQEIYEQRVVGDTIRITQILRNFISNAIKFTPEGGRIQIHVSRTHQNNSNPTRHLFTLQSGQKISLPQCGFVQVDVKDSGAGMTKEQLDSVFGEGVQFNVNQLQAGQGSGLGLYIAKGIAELHGGHIKVASEGLGLGTTFTLVLPLHHVSENELSEGQLVQLRRILEDKNSHHSESPPYKTFRILVVDDTAVNRKLLIRLLKKRGHECDEADNGLNAVDMVKKAKDDGNPYDVILLDYEMPIMNGPSAAMKMRELGFKSFIAGLTGNLLPEDVNFFKKQGANIVLAKPLDFHALEESFLEYGVGLSEPPSNSAPTTATSPLTSASTLATLPPSINERLSI